MQIIPTQITFILSQLIECRQENVCTKKKKSSLNWKSIITYKYNGWPSALHFDATSKSQSHFNQE